MGSAELPSRGGPSSHSGGALGTAMAPAPSEPRPEEREPSDSRPEAVPVPGLSKPQGGEEKTGEARVQPIKSPLCSGQPESADSK